MGVQKKDLKNKGKKLDHVVKKGAKKDDKNKVVRLVVSENAGKVTYEKPQKTVSVLKKKKNEKILNERKQKIKEAEEEEVEQFDNQGFFIVPQNVNITLFFLEETLKKNEMFH